MSSRASLSTQARLDVHFRLPLEIRLMGYELSGEITYG
jgi:hypothetical protein